MGRFQFKQFSVDDSHCGMKIGTDAVLLGAWTDCSDFKHIFDAGCGSGVIALMMAQRSPSATVTACDILESACQDAHANANASPWRERINIVKADLSQGFQTVLPQGSTSFPHPFLIVSNPPFFNESLHSPDSARALARHGETFDVETLIKQSAHIISEPCDSLAFIAPSQRDEEIDFLLTLHHLSPRRICKVYPSKDKAAIRTLWQVWSDKTDLPLRRSTLYLRGDGTTLTEEYKTLTKDFYLDK